MEQAPVLIWDDVDHVLSKHCDEEGFSLKIYLLYTSIPYQLPGWVCPSRVGQQYQQYTITTDFYFFFQRESQHHGVCPRDPLSPPKWFRNSFTKCWLSFFWWVCSTGNTVYWLKVLGCLNNSKSGFWQEHVLHKKESSHPPPLHDNFIPNSWQPFFFGG